MGSGKRGHVQGGSDGGTSAPDLALFVREAVERVEMGRFQVNARGSGDVQYHPRMMLALLIYCFANGIFSSRRIERATFRDIGVRYLAANTRPDHSMRQRPQ
ncbi:MAG: transposase [SAR324 cluster bacterium]|nr:transposase [SAR324 cluster bacterium]